MIAAQDQERLRHAVMTAEVATSAEIAVACLPQSDDYAIETSLLAAFISVVIAAAFYRVVPTWSPEKFFGLGAGLFACLLLACHFLSIGAYIASTRAKAASTARAAARIFAAQGLDRTKDRRGLLIFLSFAERRIEILADQGLADKIPADVWQDIAEKLSQNIKGQGITPALIHAIETCGAVLALHFPAGKDDPGNELPDDIILN